LSAPALHGPIARGFEAVAEAFQRPLLEPEIDG